MSWYLAVAVKGVPAKDLRNRIRSPLRATDASEMPIGRAARGDWKETGPVLLEHGAGSGRLIGRQAVKPNPKVDRREDLRAKLSELGAEYQTDIGLIFHWFSGLLTKEEIKQVGEVRTTVGDFEALLGDLQEDVRYVIAP